MTHGIGVSHEESFIRRSALVATCGFDQASVCRSLPSSSPRLQFGDMVTSRASVLIGCALFVGIMGCLHFVRQDLSPLARGISRYAGSDTLAIATVAFLALAGAAAALASLLNRGPAVWLVLSAAAGLVVVAATPIGNPATPAAVTALHTLGGLAFYLGAVGAMLFSPASAGNRVLSWTAAAVLCLFLGSATGVPGLRLVVGLLQRGVFTLVILWMLKVAVHRTAGREVRLADYS
jgi:hypothetical protein